MSFFIWWGSRRELVRRGVVVDYCWVCRTLQPFVVVDSFMLTHVYSVTVGGGAYEGSTRMCFGCQNSYALDANRYAEVLPLGAATTLSLHEGLRRCLPRLAEVIEIAGALREATAKKPYRDVDGRTFRELAADTPDLLAALANAGWDVAELAYKIRQWERLPEDELREAVAELRGIARGAALVPE
ncbi:MAG: hypothetical protein KC776_00320 [Myxococcales bacterium]|nr:hypothetical protein [Myxococcales bacterium]MCB9580825.1 hypothetical protein [Polyangiaceae bacterium]